MLSMYLPYSISVPLTRASISAVAVPPDFDLRAIMKTPARITNRPFCRQLVQHVTRARPFSRTAIGAMAATNKVKFAEGSDEAALTKVLDGLTSGTPKWSLTPNGQGVERSFKFKTFAKTWVGCLSLLTR